MARICAESPYRVAVMSLVAIKHSAAIDLQYLDSREAEQVIHDLSATGDVPKETTEGARSFLEKRAGV